MLLAMLSLCESPGARLARASQGSYLCEASDKSYPLGCSIGWKCSRKPIDPTWNMFLSQNKCFTCKKSGLATEIPVENVHLGRSKVGLPGFPFVIQAVDGLPLPRANHRGRPGPEHRFLLPQPDLWGQFFTFLRWFCWIMDVLTRFVCLSTCFIVFFLLDFRVLTPCSLQPLDSKGGRAPNSLPAYGATKQLYLSLCLV